MIFLRIQVLPYYLHCIVFNRRGVTPKLLKLGGEKLTVVSQTALISDNCPWISVRPDNWEISRWRQITVDSTYHCSTVVQCDGVV